MRLVVLAVVAVVLAVAVSLPFIFGWFDGESDVIDLSHVPVRVPVELVGTPVFVPAMTHDADELRRVAGEHAALMTSIPPTAVVTPTFTVDQLRESSFVGVSAEEAAAGIEVEVPVVGWFDPDEGLVFYRGSGGDWTGRGVRDAHPYARLVYYDGYPADVASFANGTLYEEVARDLAFGAADAAPWLGTPTPELVRTFMRELGWELRPGVDPYINVWTTFEYLTEGALHTYAVGGVMRLDVVSRALEGEEKLDYVVPGPFVGPVVVERRGLRRS